MQAVAPTISVAPTVGSVVQRVAHIAAPVLAAGVWAAIVFNQRSPLTPSSVTLPRREPRGRMQLTVVNVEPMGPIGPRWHLKSEKGVQISPLFGASTSLLSGELGGLSHTIPMLPKRRRSLPSPRASKDVPYSYRNPAMTKKPKWWWRILACLSHLVMLHDTLVYNNLHPFLEAFKFSTYWRLPTWSPVAYFFVAYLGVVMIREWPHFLRFHVLIGYYLDFVSWVISKVMPFAVYSCKVNMHFWAAISFAYFFIVLESMRRALAGMYSDIPFLSDWASRLLDYYG